MKRPLVLFAACAASVGASVASPAKAGVRPATFELEVFRVAVSTSGDCSSPIVTYAAEQPAYVDLMAEPTLGEAHLDDGTYVCLMFEVAPSVVFSPAASDGACVAGTPATMSFCEEGLVAPADGGSTPDGAATPVRQLDGTTTSCGASDRVVLYLSRWSNGATSEAKPFDPFQPPVAAGDGDHGVALFGALDVSGGGSQVGTLVVEVADSAYSDGTSCKMHPPKIGFESAPASADAGAGDAAPPKN